MIAKTFRTLFLLEKLDLEEATGFEGARWEYFQLAHLNDDSTFRIEDKSRQIAWSWLIAAEAVADAILNKRDSIFVSINQEEAKEKIRYARRIVESLHPEVQPVLVRDNELFLEFDQRGGPRLTSLPAKPPRGRAQSNVYLDEFAHVQRDKMIYTAALPVISKGGRLRIGSSPLGASGVFWEIFGQKLRQYPGYRRKTTPWWEIFAFCVNVPEARKLAPGMPTAHRVELFGNDRIKAIFANMPEEDFRQEYEAEFVDESTAWITWDEIQAAQTNDLYCLLAEGKGKNLDRVYNAIHELQHNVRMREDVLAVGVDIGRTRNTTEIYVGGINTLGSYPLRLALTLDNVEFDDQQSVLHEVLTQLPIVAMMIDRNGLGMNLAENLSRDYPGKAHGADFTNATKNLWATDAKMLIQQGKTPLPVDRDIAYQIHSIKKRVTPSRNLVFDTETNEKHHADKFWAWALMLAAAKSDHSMPDEELQAMFDWRSR